MKTLLKLLGGLLLLVIVVGLGGYFWASSKVDTALAKRYDKHALGMTEAVKAASVDAGRHIVTVRNGCIDCHGTRLEGKVVADDPMVGTVWGTNLTPARLSAWSDDQIADAIRYGVHREGRPLVVMPSYEYQHLAKEDVAAIIAYLRSVPAVESSVPPVRLGPVVKLLYALGKMPLVPAELIDQKAMFAGKPAEGPTAEFGKYLATTACSGCHGIEFRGGPIPGGPPDWPPASPIRLGANATWTQANFKSTIQTGKSALDGHMLKAPMPVAIYAKLSDVEVSALWLYLSSLR